MVDPLIGFFHTLLQYTWHPIGSFSGLTTFRRGVGCLCGAGPGSQLIWQTLGKTRFFPGPSKEPEEKPRRKMACQGYSKRANSSLSTNFPGQDMTIALITPSALHGFLRAHKETTRNAPRNDSSECCQRLQPGLQSPRSSPDVHRMPC